MKLITINDVNSDWKKVITFSDETFLLVDVKQLKTLISEQDKCFSLETLGILFSGNILRDELLVNTLVLLTENVLTLNIFQTSENLKNLIELSSLEFDTISLDAATKWATEDSLSNIDTVGLKKFVKALSANTPVAHAAIALPVDPPIHWVQFSLLLRLVVTCFVFCYNKDMTLVKQAAMGGLALVIYLFHIGAARLWIRLLFRYMMREFFHLDHNNVIIEQPVALNNPLNPPAGAAAGNVQNNGRPFGARPAAGHNMTRIIQRIIETVSKLTKEGVVVPVAPGLHNDVLAVAVSLVGSLFPQWTPTGAPILTWE